LRTLGAALLLLAATVAIAAPTDGRDTVRRLDEITKRLNQLEAWLNDAEKRRARWLGEIEVKDREIDGVNRDVAAVQARIRTLDQELAALHTQRSALEARRTEQARRIAEHLTAAWRLSGQDVVKLVLNQESPETVERIMRYHRYFSDARLATLDAFKATLAELDSNAALVEASRARQQAERTVLEQRERVLAAERSERRKLITDLASQTESREAERRRLQADQARLASLLRELERRSREAEQGGFANRRGKLPWPVAGTIRHRFGAARSGGQMKWSGTVFQAPQGTPVAAVANGRVVFADWLRGFGLLTIIDHGGGYMTLYGHADAVLKQVGDLVEGGEVIASAGQSGGQSAPGLYFEIRLKGDAQDPHKWLRANP
jgi:septal ring factor EnvC (AmiA/AmiB activator)